MENLDIKNPEVLEGTLPYLSPEQTGRMNRTLDYRTDFYSMGVTFYEILTGELPHTTNDALEMVHCHIAKQATPPHVKRPEIPQALSEIVMRLMAKNAEDRYESSLGIKADLEECLRQFNAHGAILPFALARQDVPEQFRIPQKLYGRTDQVGALMEAFDRVADGAREIALVSGYSGIGKTSLVREIYRPITRKRGYFAVGKFDRFERHTPYSALINAFRDLVRQLLTEDESKLRYWRNAILEAVGANASVITDIIPELTIIIGPQQPLPALDPTGSKNRFDLTFRSFIGTFCQQAHPLAVFLDDLQWSDLASLTFLESVMSDPDIGHLLVLGAYRSNEVDSSHPLTLTLNRLKSQRASVNETILTELRLPELIEIICDTVRRQPDVVEPLAKLVEQKNRRKSFLRQ